jgi:hypothetical protein
MKYFVEESLSNFNFWSGGKDRADLLTSEQFDTVEQMMEEIEPADGWSDTAINDFFWFEFDTIAQCLGYADEEHLEADIKQNEVEEAQEWAEGTSTDYNSLFAIAGLKIEDYESINEDGETECDWDQATEDFMDWWNGMDDIDQVEEYRKYQ